MGTIRCRYCHEYIDTAGYSSHEAEHLEILPDGQQAEYATLPPEGREHGPLWKVPTAYFHIKCGSGTIMPDDIVRSYLENPYLYMADATFCTSCGKHVPFKESKWSDTGENLQTYMNRLRAEKPELRPGILTRMFISVAKHFV